MHTMQYPSLSSVLSENGITSRQHRRQLPPSSALGAGAGGGASAAASGRGGGTSAGMMSNATFPSLQQQQQQQQQAQSPAGGGGDLPMSNSLLEIAARRSMSDSALSRGKRFSFSARSSAGSSPSPASSSTSASSRSSATSYSNTMSMVVNRSGGSAVKAMIQTILERSAQELQLQQQQQQQQHAQQQQQQQQEEAQSESQQLAPTRTVEPPEEECCVLAQCSVDSYYKVVIAGRDGIPALIMAMRAFPLHRELQECCCIALGNLCVGSGGGGSGGASGGSNPNSTKIDDAGGVSLIVAAMRNHPQSVAVQSAACEALRNMCDTIVVPRVQQRRQPSQQLQQQQQQQQPPAVVQSSGGRFCSAGEPQILSAQLVDCLSHAKTMCLHPNHRRIADSLLRVVVATNHHHAVKPGRSDE